MEQLHTEISAPSAPREPENVSLTEVPLEDDEGQPAEIEVTISDDGVTARYGSPGQRPRSAEGHHGRDGATNDDGGEGPSRYHTSERTPLAGEIHVDATVPESGRVSRVSLPSYNELYGEFVQIPPPEAMSTLPIGGRTATFRAESDPTLLSETQIKDALFQHVSEKCCYGYNAAREMDITNIVGSHAIHYRLVSFTEQRESKKVYQAYHGEAVDRCRPPPGIWDIVVTPSLLFKEEEQTVSVPYSGEVKPCYRCNGVGKIRYYCASCSGRGRTLCSSCNGSGSQQSHRTNEMRACKRCYGEGNIRCLTCGGSTETQCRTCHGKKILKSTTVVLVKFRQIISDYIVESDKTDVPKECLAEVTGVKIMEDIGATVNPLTDYPDTRVKNKSKELVAAHQQMSRNKWMVIRHQKHSIQVVPLTEIHWTWEDKADRFWIYGDERKVHFPSYPQNVCFGLCNLL
ncbi:protein SSUH2 homolog isoform X2 [Ptychodera flava]|uniref:protein SSUH2 homolog isoform X2 n=1 Tax=Ptychodera flava TaxID=63121 RepID=UPI00396A9B29